MAFDQNTRNRLQRFVSESRAILIEEFTRQLQSTFGMDPQNGDVADIETLAYLDNNQRETATFLRDTLAHYISSISAKSEKERAKQALDRIVREQAFTVLNRLAALRMAEAREFLIESISKGFSSKGFQLYKNLSGTGLGETGETYQNYLFSIFDEFTLDLAVLFDRHSSQGRLFPRESALLKLLEQINHFEIEPLWAEDETIGWIYQYFNSQEERKRMRAESQAPRNSRELAVRNQFFTPRYVVDFLTDNTLGRVWYEMTQGKTSLVDSCRYLVSRRNEAFLVKGETVPDEGRDQSEILSQEELLNQPVHILFRALKDPREILMLDPACGSMHFGLYAFDLFEKIYKEAWLLESELGVDAFERTKNFQPLHHSYTNFEEFQRSIPKLIIEYNIHGVDIDPRAVQIAGLSLWQRAQRSWQLMNLKPDQRPVVNKSNIVCAEPMPGETKLLREFSASLKPRVLGQLLEIIFDKMNLAGEAGSLLKIEQEIVEAIEQARSAFNKELKERDANNQMKLVPEWESDQQKSIFDFTDLPDETEFWETAEQRILNALKDYAETAEAEDTTRRLFAEDAAKGFSFIDLCRKRYDVVLMNPPFGEVNKKIGKYFESEYPNWNKNILCSFIERAKDISPFGYSASVIDRSFLNKSTYEKFRNKILLSKDSIDFVLDLGWGVLDGANVEVSSTICSGSGICGSQNTIFLDLREFQLDEKDDQLQLMLNKFGEKSINKIFQTWSFKSFPNSAFVYDLPKNLLGLFSKYQNLSQENFISYTGHQLKSERHFFCFWEIPFEQLKIKSGSFDLLYNGGEYSRYVKSPKEVVNFGFIEHLTPKDISDYTFVLRNKEMHRKPGVYFGKRGNYLDAHITSSNFIFTVEGQACPLKSTNDALFLSGFLNSLIASRLLASYSGQHKYSGYINLLPINNSNNETKENIIKKVCYATELKLKYCCWDETSILFKIPIWFNQNFDKGNLHQEIKKLFKADQERIEKLSDEIDALFNELFEINDQESLNDLLEFKKGFQEDKKLYTDLISNDDLDTFLFQDQLSFIFGYLMGRWEIERFSDSLNIDVAEFYQSDISQTNIFSCNTSNQGILDISSILSKIPEALIRYYLQPAKLEESLIKADSFRDYEQYFILANGFFQNHLNRYSTGRRQAPIYWPLQTPSNSYTLWIYYHRLNNQTLYICVNDFVEPKLKNIINDLNNLQNKSDRNRIEEKELEKLSNLESELKDFRDELLRVADFWRPNLSDGVQITAAPLWKLFQHRQWQIKLKETWEKLEKGEYDWAHLAFSIWPERVLRKCHKDRSLAIAHDVESDFWVQEEVAIVRRGKDTGNTKTEWQPKKLSESELKELIKKKIKEMN
jgi:hypothetical protein